MNMKCMLTSLAAGAAVTSMCYVLSNSSSRQKRCLKKDAKKTLRDAAGLMEDFSSMFM